MLVACYHAMMDNRAETVGELLKRVRTEKELTQGQVIASMNARAERLGIKAVSREWLSSVENGRSTQPERVHLELAAHALRLQPEVLLAAAGYRIESVPAPEPTVEDLLEEALYRVRNRPLHVHDAPGEYDGGNYEADLALLRSQPNLLFDLVHGQDPSPQTVAILARLVREQLGEQPKQQEDALGARPRPRA